MNQYGSHKPEKDNNKCGNGTRKTKTDNQWVSTGLRNYPDLRERRDGPGGESNDVTSDTASKQQNK